MYSGLVGNEACHIFCHIEYAEGFVHMKAYPVPA